jgi:hypothetical protein
MGMTLEGAGITLCWWSLIRELHPAMIDNHEVCELEFFAGNGDTIAVVSVPTTALRAATRQDIIHAFEKIRIWTLVVKIVRQL